MFKMIPHIEVGTAQHGTEQLGNSSSTERNSLARHSAAWHGTAQHATARLGTAQLTACVDEKTCTCCFLLDKRWHTTYAVLACLSVMRM